jgi:hypothetical protein
LPINCYQILVCDWNATLDPNLDRLPANDIRPTSTTPDNTLLKYLTNHHRQSNLIDFWRLINPDTYEYTHSNFNSPPSQSRLDYYLISENLIPLSHTSNIDHNTTLKPNLHHKIINYSFSDIFNTPTLNKITPQKKLKFNFKDVTTDEILQYNQSLNTDPAILKANSLLTSAIDNNIPLSIPDLDSIARSLQESIITHATTHLNHTKIPNAHHKPSNTLNNKLYLTSKLANKCLQFHTLTKKISAKLDRIYKYWCKHTNKISDTTKCHFIIHNIENFLYKDKLNTIKEKLQYIDTNTGNNIKQMIQRVLNDHDKFYGPTFIQHADELSSEPSIIKNTIHEYFSELYGANLDMIFSVGKSLLSPALY